MLNSISQRKKIFRLYIHNWNVFFSGGEKRRATEETQTHDDRSYESVRSLAGASGLGNLVVIVGLGVSRVNDLRMVFVHETDESLGLQLLQSKASQGPANLQPFRHDRRSDQLVRGNFLVQLVVGRFIEEYKIVELVADFPLGPLLLLGFAATTVLLRRGLSRLRVLLRGHLIYMYSQNLNKLKLLNYKLPPC